MFRTKKTDFPARPQPPSWEQMEEDLKAATESDIIFTLSAGKAGGKNTTDQPEKSATGSDAETLKDYMDDEELFQQAVEFVEKNDKLLNNIHRLTDEREELQQVSNNLKLTLENVKKQALVAIDRY
ncbi:UPF0449 protein C19orf25 homolog [Homarus americanus]|uniref:UPF0449 protein C19orf25 homolog n=1 Tax=Homarus americanus TaxID=6706 RepID=UPI001C49604B|nr:UPF0449 protein C19orf25 homolog [Homarus americanus]